MDERQIKQIYKKLGKRIKELRLQRKMTQEQMGDFGFSTRFYQRIEAGKIIHFKTIIKIAKILKTSLSEIFKDL